MENPLLKYIQLGLYCTFQYSTVMFCTLPTAAALSTFDNVTKPEYIMKSDIIIEVKMICTGSPSRSVPLVWRGGKPTIQQLQES